MSAKNALAIQRCEFSCKELDEFLSSYSIPSEYRVILPTPTQTILDAPPGARAFDDLIIFLAGLQSSWEHGQQRPAIFVSSKEMSFKNFIYIEDDEDLTFLPNDFSLGMSAKNALAIQRCEFSCKELDEFLSSYSIPSEYRVILPTPTQTILDAPPGLNPFGCSKLTTFIVMCKVYDCEPSVELFRGFFNLCKAGSWLTFQKRSKKHIPSLLDRVITHIKGWHQRSFFIQDTIVPSKFPRLLKENMLDVKSFKDKLHSAGLQSSWEHGQQRPAIFVSSKEMSFKNFIYIEDDEDLTFLPNDFSLGFNIGTSSESINTEHVRYKEEPMVEPTTEPVTKPVNERVGTTVDLGGVPKEILLLFTLGVLRPALGRGSAKQGEGFLDNHLDVGLLDLYDHCYARQAVMDNEVNRRFYELFEVLEKLRGEADVMRVRELACEEEYEGIQAKCEAAMTDFDKNPTVLLLREKMSSLAAKTKEHKGNLDRLMLENQKWSGYQVSLLALESKVASLEAEKANLEATEALLPQEIEEVKHDRKEVVSKVVPYACMKLHSDELGMLVGKLVKGYRPSYEKEHTQASNDLAIATFSWLNNYVADASASVEALLSKNPPILQKPIPLRTQMPVPSSQLATPYFAPASKPMSPPADIVKPSLSSND
nr:hypothetical protein [Tanacetum cinerariifolium]